MITKQSYNVNAKIIEAIHRGKTYGDSQSLVTIGLFILFEMNYTNIFKEHYNFLQVV